MSTIGVRQVVAAQMTVNNTLAAGGRRTLGDARRRQVKALKDKAAEQRAAADKDADAAMVKAGVKIGTTIANLAFSILTFGASSTAGTAVNVAKDLKDTIETLEKIHSITMELVDSGVMLHEAFVESETAEIRELADLLDVEAKKAEQESLDARGRRDEVMASNREMSKTLREMMAMHGRATAIG